MGIVFARCQETFRDNFLFRGRSGCISESPWEEEEEEEEHSSKKVRRVRRGDVIAIFVGETHWCYNDGNEPLQIVSIVDALIINSGGGVTV